MKNIATLFALLFLIAPGSGIAADSPSPNPSSILQKDIEYGRVGDVSLKLDASVPDKAGLFPAVIIVQQLRFQDLGSIFESFRSLHGILRNEYFINTST
jgi:hypothetical protein